MSAASFLGLVPLVALWTLVCLGLGAWVRRALRRSGPDARPGSDASARDPHATPTLAEYENAVGRVLEDGVVTEQERVDLVRLRAAWGLSPGDHAQAVARVQETVAERKPRRPSDS